MMETLPRTSALKVFSGNCYGVVKSSSGGILRPAIRIVRLPKLEFGASAVLLHNTVGSFPISSACADSEAVLTIEENEIEQTEIQTTYALRTVHVKFKLHRACQFGEHFLLAGEDPIFGLWDTSNAVPLQWSEGHIWTAELDIPCGKSIHFKFILKGPSGEVEWQPGPDRFLQTWESNKTIVVTEDWENLELQEIREEETTQSEYEESITDQNGLAVIFVGMEDTLTSENNPIILTQEENPIIITEESSVLVPALTPNPKPLAPEEFSLKASMDEAIVHAFVATEESNSQMAPEVIVFD
ncbi:uncharacterized protein [Aristolochia californica]|uniref:uncharacterized protein n=1 Tax=Aristolochia californica TaxID=171875 RepID=UPI0035D88462